jgi:hypothetical protein
VRHQLDQARVDEDTSGDGIEDTIHQQKSLTLWRKGGAHTKTDGDGNGCRKTIAKSKQVRRPSLRLWPRDFCKTSTETETLECLMENEDDIKSDELSARDGKCQTNEDGVEDDTKLEDENGGELCRVRFRQQMLRLPFTVVDLLVRNVVALVAKVVFTSKIGVGSVSYDVFRSPLTVFHAKFVAVVAMTRSMRVVMVAAKVAIPHNHELEEKHDEDGHEGDAFRPRILRDDTGQALVAKSFIRWRKKVDEGCGDNDTRSEVLAEKEDP